MRSCVGPDVLAAELRDAPGAEGGVQRAPADAVARLEHDDRPVGGHERPGGREAREPGADDAHIGASGAPPGGRCRRGAQREERRAGGSGADELAAGECVVHGARA